MTITIINPLHACPLRQLLINEAGISIYHVHSVENRNYFIAMRNTSVLFLFVFVLVLVTY